MRPATVGPRARRDPGTARGGPPGRASRPLALRQDAAGGPDGRAFVSVAHAVLYRLIQAARREPVMRALRELERTQWWAEERLREDQLVRLRRVLEAAVRAPHYRLAWAATGAIPGDVR